MTIPNLGIRVHGGLTPSACVDLARAAEAAGLTGIWFAENAFARGILPAAAACALATSRVGIGAGVFNPYSRHPTMMAMEIGGLDELSGGRASLSIGSGIASATTKMGLDASKPLAAVRDALVITRALIAGEEVDHEGTTFSARKVRLDYRTRPDIPIYLAARGDNMVRLAGEAADGMIISNMCSVGFSRRITALMTAARLEAGRGPGGKVVQYMPCSVDEDRGAAIAAAKHAVAEMVPGFWALGQKSPSAKEALLSGTGIGEDEFASAAARLKAGESPLAVLDERFTSAFSLAGTPDDCLAAAAAYGEASVTELALTFSGPKAGTGMAALGRALARA